MWESIRLRGSQLNEQECFCRAWRRRRDIRLIFTFRERSEIRIPKSHIAVHLRYTNEHKSIQIEPIIKYLKLLFQQYKKKWPRNEEGTIRNDKFKK